MYEATLYRIGRRMWTLAIGGEDYPNKREIYERMRNPQPGDLCFESSSRTERPVGYYLGSWKHNNDTVHHVRRLDGKEEKWGNCDWIAFDWEEVKHEP